MPNNPARGDVQHDTQAVIRNLTLAPHTLQAIVFVLVWRRRRRRLSAPTGAAMGAAQATRPPVSNGYHQNGYQSGYPPPAQGYPVQGVAGAWGYNNGAAFGWVDGLFC